MSADDWAAPAERHTFADVEDYLPTHPDRWSFGTFRWPDGAASAGVARGRRVRPLPTTVAALLADWDAAEAELDHWAREDAGVWLGEDQVTPLVPWRPGQVLQAGANYRSHVVDLIVAELDDDTQGRGAAEKRAYGEALMDRRAAEGEPYVFLGAASAMTGALDDVELVERPGARDDWELELGVVLGKGGRWVDRSEAMSLVAGYTIVDDLTARDRVYRSDLPKIGTDWLAAKNSPTFLPTGPVVVPARFVPDPAEMRIQLAHNGILRQDELVADMIFDIPRLIEYASRMVQLMPGDLLLTGSPAGNGAHYGISLAPGDLLVGTISGLGTQRNRCVAVGMPGGRR